jgi:hypothetical protein
MRQAADEAGMSAAEAGQSPTAWRVARIAGGAADRAIAAKPRRSK